MDRVLQATGRSVTQTWYDDEETVVDPGTVTVDLTAADGTAVASNVATTGSGAAARTLELTAAHTADLTVLTLTWTGDAAGVAVQTSVVEVVGGWYLTLPDIRELNGLADTTRYTTADLRDARAWFETLAEDWTGVAWVPRYGKLVERRAATDTIYIAPKPRTVESADVDGTTVDVSGWKLYDNGQVAPDVTVTAGQLTVHYTHGHDRPDAELVEAAKVAVRSKLLTDRSGAPSRQVLLTNELGTVRLAQPGPKAATGIPEVDRVLNDRRYRPLLVG